MQPSIYLFAKCCTFMYLPQRHSALLPLSRNANLFVGEMNFASGYSGVSNRRPRFYRSRFAHHLCSFLAPSVSFVRLSKLTIAEEAD